MYQDNPKYGEYYDQQRIKAVKGLMQIALTAEKEVGDKARAAMAVIKREENILHLADGLAKDQKKENLIEAVRLYAEGYKLNPNYGEYYDQQRGKAVKGLMQIALTAEKEVADKARAAMSVITREDNMFTLADGLAKDQKEENLVEAIRLYAEGYEKNLGSFNYNETQRNKAIAGLKKLASLIDESKEESQSLQKIASDAVLALGDCYKFYSKESYPDFKEVLVFFDKIDDLHSKLLEYEKQKILIDKKEELLKVIVENNLSKFLECLTEQADVPKMKEKIKKLLPDIERLYKGDNGNNIDKIARLYGKLGYEAKAFEMYQRAEKLGYMPAVSRLANVYEKGELGQAIDIKAAADRYLKLSNNSFETERNFIRQKRAVEEINIFRKKAIRKAKKVVELAPERISEIRIPIPDRIKGEGILRFIASSSYLDAKDVFGEKLISGHPSFLAVVDKWCDSYKNIEEFVKLEEKTGGRIRHRILEGIYAGNNELAVHIKERLVSHWEKIKNPKAQELLKEFYAAEFKFAEAINHKDKEKLRDKARISEEKLDVISGVHKFESKIQAPEKRQPTAYTSSDPSWRDKMFSFFDRKGAKLIREVKAKQQAMNDSDPDPDYLDNSAKSRQKR